MKHPPLHSWSEYFAATTVAKELTEMREITGKLSDQDAQVHRELLRRVQKFKVKNKLKT